MSFCRNNAAACKLLKNLYIQILNFPTHIMESSCIIGNTHKILFWWAPRKFIQKVVSSIFQFPFIENQFIYRHVTTPNYQIIWCLHVSKRWHFPSVWSKLILSVVFTYPWKKMCLSQKLYEKFLKKKIFSFISWSTDASSSHISGNNATRLSKHIKNINYNLVKNPSSLEF